MDRVCDNCGKKILPEYKTTWSDLVFCCNSCKIIKREEYLNE